MERRLPSVLAVALIVAMATALPAETPPDPRPGATQPTREQNLDPDGYIAVHEQGVAQVDITNETLTVTGTVDVNEVYNTVDVQGTVDVGNEVDVNVTGGTVDVSVPPVTTIANCDFVLEPDQEGDCTFAAVDATLVAISGLSDAPEFLMYVESPLIPPDLAGHRTLIGIQDLDGASLTQEHPLILHSFTQPVPIDRVFLRCVNESEICHVLVNVAGN